MTPLDIMKQPAAYANGYEKMPSEAQNHAKQLCWDKMKGNRLYLIFFIHNNIVLPKSVLIMCSSNCKNKKFIMNESMEIGVLYS